MLLAAVKILEILCVKINAFGKFYCQVFYQKMIDKESEIAGITPDMKILHIGSGPFPMTALCLVQNGHWVEAVDNSEEIVRISLEVVAKFGLGDRIMIRQADGLEVDCNEFDVVWVSLHIFPKDKVLLHSLNTLKDGGKVVYRNPRGLLARIYPNLQPLQIAPNCEYQKVKVSFGKEIIMIKNLS